MKHKSLPVVLSCLFLLSGCGNLHKGITNINEGEPTVSGNITTGRVDNSVYQAVMEDGKYQTNNGRAINADRMNSGNNQLNFENGLLRLSQIVFSVDDFYFREGQKISKEQLKSWLARTSPENPEGLNPEDPNQPLIVQQLLEYDFLKEDGKTLGGISLGFAFNTIDYSSGQEVPVSQEQLMATARKTVNTVLSRVRKISGLENVPILIGLFEQALRNDATGGHYIYQAVNENGTTAIEQFETVKEEYVLLPASHGATNAATGDGLSDKFATFSTAVSSFFPSLAGVSGKVYYVDGQMQKLIIQIESNYYSQTEIISCTQFTAKQVESVFKDVLGEIEVQLHSVDREQAFIVRKNHETEIFSHIFN